MTSKHINYGYSDAGSLLDMLFYAYTLDNPIDNEDIKRNFAHLDHILSGVIVGSRLFTELSE